MVSKRTLNLAAELQIVPTTTVQLSHDYQDQDRTSEQEPQSYEFTPKVAIITALPLETSALLAVFNDFVQLPSANSGAVKLTSLGVGSDGSSGKIIHAQCVRMGNNSAAVAATVVLMRYPSVEHIIMSGIAGGIPDTSGAKSSKTHVRCGDVIIAESVSQYDFVTRKPDGHKNRQIATQPSAALMHAVDDLIHDYNTGGGDTLGELDYDKYEKPWRRPRGDKLYRFVRDELGAISSLEISHPRQTDKVGKAPVLRKAPIGSANMLLKDFEFRDLLSSEHGLAAVEMEGSGVGDAAWTFNVGYVVVRGICDYCDIEKNDKWQHHAAYLAATTARLIILKLDA